MSFATVSRRQIAYRQGGRGGNTYRKRECGPVGQFRSEREGSRLRTRCRARRAEELASQAAPRGNAVVTDHPGDDPEVDPCAQREQDKRGPHGVGVLEHRAKLRHRDERRRVGRNRHGRHGQRSVWILVLHRRLKASRRKHRAQKHHTEESEQQCTPVTDRRFPAPRQPRSPPFVSTRRQPGAGLVLQRVA